MKHSLKKSPPVTALALAAALLFSSGNPAYANKYHFSETVVTENCTINVRGVHFDVYNGLRNYCWIRFTEILPGGTPNDLLLDMAGSPYSQSQCVALSRSRLENAAASPFCDGN